jgi:colanic acid/amylovoran biosynthesis protein
MCDSDKRFVLPLLDRIEAAVANGVPTVLLSQGIGPLTDAELIQRARQILPQADRVFIRERLVAPSILRSLNVDPARVVMTGDDAIELAYDAKSDTLGTGIGVSVRLASYTNVATHHLPTIRKVLLRAATRLGVPLVAAPIDLNDADLDHVVTCVSGYDNVVLPWRSIETPLEIVRRIGRCRVMVSGTFHAAVFALSQGIPAVLLSNSEEYFAKARGLAEEFSPGSCQLIQLNAPNVEDRLTNAIDQAWATSEQLRPLILQSALRQIALGHAAYGHIQHVVQRRRPSSVLFANALNEA